MKNGDIVYDTTGRYGSGVLVDDRVDYAGFVVVAFDCLNCVSRIRPDTLRPTTHRSFPVTVWSYG